MTHLTLADLRRVDQMDRDALEAENRKLREVLDYVLRESRAKKGNLRERMEVIHDEVNYALRKDGS